MATVWAEEVVKQRDQSEDHKDDPLRGDHSADFNRGEEAVVRNN